MKWLHALPAVGALLIALGWVRLLRTRAMSRNLQLAVVCIIASVLSLGLALSWAMSADPPRHWLISVVLGSATIAVGSAANLPRSRSALQAEAREVQSLRKHASNQQQQVTLYRSLIRECPVAIAAFSPPTGRSSDQGMRLLWCSDAWLTFHGHPELVPEGAVGTCHYILNPEVGDNEAWRAVHERVALTGVPEGSTADALASDPIAWRAWRGPGGEVCMSAILHRGPQDDDLPVGTPRVASWTVFDELLRDVSAAVGVGA